MSRYLDWALVISIVASFASGLWIGGMTERQRISALPRVEVAMPEIRHESGAVTLKRSNAQPPPKIKDDPVGERVRTIELDIQPIAEPVHAQIDLIRLPDESHRVTIQGIPGVTGIDFPADKPERELKRNGVFAVWDTEKQPWMMMTRDFKVWKIPVTGMAGITMPIGPRKEFRGLIGVGARF